MSAAFKNAKKKFNQNDLRRLMQEHKGKTAVAATKKIDSPLAKYNEQGQLTCILCKSIVRSEAVWTVHVNAKLHKENVAQAKQLKEKTKNFTKKPVNKRPHSPTELDNTKKIKGILKNAPSTSIPEDFFDSANKKEVKKEPDEKQDVFDVKPRVDDSEEAMQTDAADEALPEGFFDDPIMDAKARNIEYKDPVEEEWERFLKEMKEETSLSAAIIAEDQDEATATRQIDEIDEQMRNWSRVIDLERKKELLARRKSTYQAEKNDSENEDLDQDVDEFLDWRAKKSYK